MTDGSSDETRQDENGDSVAPGVRKRRGKEGEPPEGEEATQEAAGEESEAEQSGPSQFSVTSSGGRKTRVARAEGFDPRADSAKKKEAEGTEEQGEEEPSDEASDAGASEAGASGGRQVVDVSAESDESGDEDSPSAAPEVDTDVSLQDFEALLAGESRDEGASELKSLEPGDTIEGEVVEIGERYLFVHLGGKTEGMATRRQFLDADDELELDIGDTAEFYVLSKRDGEIMLGKHVESGDGGLDALERAYDSGAPIQGRVAARNKGGFEVDVMGVSAFCPVSHIDRHNAEDLDVYLNQTFRFKVIEIRDDGRTVVVSRSELLDAESREKAKKTLENLEEGAVVEGVVSNVVDFGAFVDIGGVEGLVHVSELAWSHFDDPRDVVSSGDQVEVKVLDIEEQKKGSPRIGLSVKQAKEDPWETVNRELHVGKKVEGTVVRLAPFGAFVEVLPGVDGLVHVSEMSWEKHVRHPREVVQVGQLVTVEVLDIDMIRRRLSLSMKAVGGDPWDAIEETYSVGESVEGTVENVEDFGAFISLGGGVTALLPRSEMSLGSGETPHSKYRDGATVEAFVLSIEPGRRRMALSESEPSKGGGSSSRKGGGGRSRSRGSRKGGGKKKRDSQVAYQDSSDSGGGGFGTLGDLLRDKLEED
jgi:small subunit ribosomal protein S1